jgi:NAD(P)-dependent dehydrogenase (short-subunit alcohol dehydrogenase family)
MPRVEGKTAVVTGGTTGIGYTAAERLLAEGAKTVLITGQNPERVRDAAAKLGNRASGLVVDQRQAGDIAKLAETVARDLGGVDVLFLNAGIALTAPTETQEEARYDEQMDVNVRGTFFTMQALLPHLRDGASVIVTTSVVDQIAMPGMAAYAASKAALRSLVRTWAAEFKDRGIRVNSVAPGPIETPIFGKLGLDEVAAQGMAERIQTLVPMGRFGSTGEIAGAVAFLASSDASYMTGEEITIAGGMAAL